MECSVISQEAQVVEFSLRFEKQWFEVGSLASLEYI